MPPKPLGITTALHHRLASSAALVLVLLVTSVTLACGMTLFQDLALFTQSAQPDVTLQFADLQPGEQLAIQYQAVGLTFLDGNDVSRTNAAFHDNFGIWGGLAPSPAIALHFSGDIYSLGALHPGALRLRIWDDFNGTQLGSFDFGFSGTGLFAGVISDLPFRYVVIEDWVDDSVYIDDLLYGRRVSPPIPEPSSALLLALGLFGGSVAVRMRPVRARPHSRLA